MQEMVKFWAILMGMGLVDRPCLKSYWARNWLHIPGFPKIMKRDRFLTIWRKLRFCDVDAAEQPNGPGDRRSRNYDSLYRVRQLLNAILERCSALRQPEQLLVIDEQVIAFTGHFAYRQVIGSFVVIVHGIRRS